MKKIYVSSALALLFSLASCGTKSLEVESQTSITTDYLYSSPEGLSRAAVALYVKDRSLLRGYDGNKDQVPAGSVMFDYSTDIMVFRAGLNASIARHSGVTSATSIIGAYWDILYQIVGKANEVIHYSKVVDPGLENSLVRRAYGEASFFRARAYFELYKRFENLYLNTIPTTTENMEGRVYRPSSKKEIFAQIKSDLETAVEYLDWETPKGEPGRLTKAAPYHMRAQLAMWEEDWQGAIDNCEAIFTSGYYSMLDSMTEVFTGADLNHSEAIYVYQFSPNAGGGNTVSNGVPIGHYVNSFTVARYWRQDGFKECLEYGGKGHGYLYPNTYLLSLYDKQKDNRYKEMFIHELKYIDESILPEGVSLGDVADVPASSYIGNGHPYSFKYADKWTNVGIPTQESSFRDIIVYRLAETYLMAAEAYFHMEGGSSAKALEYYNKTYARAMGEPFTGTLTLEDILEETARELHLEGVRWNQLKRLGLLAERVKLHGGDSKAEDPKLDKDYTEPRQNWDDKWWRWPIPQSALDVMPGYPQNAGW